MLWPSNEDEWYATRYRCRLICKAGFIVPISFNLFWMLLDSFGRLYSSSPMPDVAPPLIALSDMLEPIIWVLLLPSLFAMVIWALLRLYDGV